MIPGPQGSPGPSWEVLGGPRGPKLSKTIEIIRFGTQIQENLGKSDVNLVSFIIELKCQNDKKFVVEN